MTAAPTTVLVVDDDELTRTGIAAILATEPGVHVIGEAADGTEVLPLVLDLRPDVVLMDVRMPRLDGIQTTVRLRAQLPDPPKVLVITTFDNDDYVYEALRAGASGFLLKQARPAQIAHAIRLVASGDSVLFPEAVRRLVAARATPPARARTPTSLTAREEEILRLMCTGMCNGDIARHLVIGEETVKTHVGNVFAKLAVANRTQAVIHAFETGLALPRGTGAPAQRH